MFGNFIMGIPLNTKKWLGSRNFGQTGPICWERSQILQTQNIPNSKITLVTRYTPKSRSNLDFLYRSLIHVSVSILIYRTSKKPRPGYHIVSQVESQWPQAIFSSPLGLEGTIQIQQKQQEQLSFVFVPFKTKKQKKQKQIKQNQIVCFRRTLCGGLG